MIGPGSVKRFILSMICVASCAQAAVPVELLAELNKNKYQPWSREQFRKMVAPIGDPFWEKPKVQKRMQENRDIVVSVVKTRADHREQLRMQGAGIISTDGDFAFETAKQIENLPQVSEHISKVEWQKPGELLYMQGVILGWTADMLIQIDIDAEQKTIRWRNVSGDLASLTGMVRVRDKERQKAEISMTAFCAFEKLPLPAILLEFGLEWALQRVAFRMRQFIEEKYGKSQKEREAKTGRAS